jgi:hypothetical protein
LRARVLLTGRAGTAGNELDDAAACRIASALADNTSVVRVDLGSTPLARVCVCARARRR